MKKTIAIMITALGTAMWGAAALADDLTSLRGDQGLMDMSPEPEKKRVEVIEGGFERSFKEQPPMISHAVDKYPVTLNQNGCLKCHSEKTYEKEKAPRVSDSHYMDRDGNKLERLAPRRYFCMQCHAVQLKGAPLVENTFEGRR
jgi:cytochrome c-type protein NapB